MREISSTLLAYCDGRSINTSASSKICSCSSLFNDLNSFLKSRRKKKRERDVSMFLMCGAVRFCEKYLESFLCLIESDVLRARSVCSFSCRGINLSERSRFRFTSSLFFFPSFLCATSKPAFQTV